MLNKFSTEVLLKETDVKIPVTVSYYYTPGEKQTWEYPGCPPEISDISLTDADGDDCSYLLDDDPDIGRYIVDQCWQDVQDNIAEHYKPRRKYHVRTWHRRHTL